MTYRITKGSDKFGEHEGDDPVDALQNCLEDMGWEVFEINSERKLDDKDYAAQQTINQLKVLKGQLEDL